MKCFFGNFATKSVVFVGALFSLALATSSCQDETFGFTEGEVSVARYTREFVNEFGQPADGHQWGFDAAQAAMDVAMGGISTRSNGYPDYTFKSNENVGQTNMKYYELYGIPSLITQTEHDEVFAWFSNHRVIWANTPAYFSEQADMAGTRTNAALDKSNQPLNEGVIAAFEIDSDFDYGTMSPNCYGDCIFDGNSISFFNGWVQHVANDPSYEYSLGNNRFNCSNMDWFCFLSLNAPENKEHVKDFNSAAGYGWEKQTSDNLEGSPIATLVLESNFNVCAYRSSIASGALHDKYYIAYLEGEGYAGYYLGMDLEGDAQNSNPNERLKADGICNDWIIKISDVGKTAYNPARIMCEDLGSSFDTDFNDVVYDVKYDNGICFITLQAAGGTKEIEVWYGERNGTDCNGNESVQLTMNGQTEVHAMFNVRTSNPVNVKAIGATAETRGVDGKSPLMWALAFGNQGNATSCWDNDTRQTIPVTKGYPNGIFSFSDINIYVREPKADAEWVSLAALSQKTNVPLRICVPVTTPWCKEMRDIKASYYGFLDWVKDPSKTFWSADKEKKGDNLYQ